VENLALRQQLSVFKRRNRRPKLAVRDKLFWVLAPWVLVRLEKVGIVPDFDFTGP
jgi:hypothetical protein